jgi:hypothetical protein
MNKKKPAIPTRDQITALRGNRHAGRLASPDSAGSETRIKIALAHKNKLLKEATHEIYDI